MTDIEVIGYGISAMLWLYAGYIFGTTLVPMMYRAWRYGSIDNYHIAKFNRAFARFRE